MNASPPVADSGNGKTLQKGKYVFIGALAAVHAQELSVPFFVAKAISIEEHPTGYAGDVSLVNVGDLILRQSTYIDENGKAVEAHKLYTWPPNLGSTEQWTAAKLSFLNHYILNFPIEILSLQESNGVTWRFISPEKFKKIPENIHSTAAFKEFAAHQEEYFFLRRILNEPK